MAAAGLRRIVGGASEALPPMPQSGAVVKLTAGCLTMMPCQPASRQPARKFDVLSAVLRKCREDPICLFDRVEWQKDLNAHTCVSRVPIYAFDVTAMNTS